MATRKLSELLDEATNEAPPNYWQARLLEMQELLKEKKYSQLGRQIHNLLESNRVTGRVKQPKQKTAQTPME